MGRKPERERALAAADDVRLIVAYGLPGVGKSSFLVGAAAELAGARGARTASIRCHPGDDFTAVIRGLEMQLGPGEPLASLAPLVLTVDDAHHLPEGWIDELELHAQIWWLVGSRRLLSIAPERVDHLVLRLGGLARGEMRALWEQLTRLYGAPSLSMDEALAQAAGNPRLLKQLFAAPEAIRDEDPLELASLDPLEAQLLAQAVAFRRPVPPEALSRKAGDARARPAVCGLVRKLLIEPSGADGAQPGELVRRLVARSPLAPTRREHLHCMNWLREDSHLERLHHALAAGESAVAMEVLQTLLLQRRERFAFQLEPELQRAVEELGDKPRAPAIVRDVHRRLRAWQRPDEGLEGEADAATLAELELARGEPEAAADRLRRAGSPALPHLLMMLGENGSEDCDPLIFGRERELLSALDDAPPDPRTPAWLTGARLRATAELALAGPQPALATVEQALTSQHGLGLRGLRLPLELIAAQALLARGDRAAARNRARVALAELSEPGLLGAALERVIALADAAEGRAAPVTARPGQGYDAASLQASDLELALAQGRLEPARREAAELIARADEAGFSHLGCRARLSLAEAELRAGEPQAAQPHVDAALAAAVREGWLREQLLAGLIGAALLRAADRADEAAEWLERTRAGAAGHPVEAEAARAGVATLAGESFAPGRAAPLVRRLFLAVPLTARVRRDGREALLACPQVRALDLRGERLVVDALQGRIRVGQRWIDLSRRDTLLQLMRVLGATPDVRIPVSELIQRAWGFEYHPLRHRARVTMAISRLRQLLGGSLLGWNGEGYSLEVRGSVALLEPRPSAAAARRSERKR